MNNQVERFDPQSLMAGVRDRIKATFVSLIPDDEWERLVKAEIETFFQSKDRYNSTYYTSDFQMIVNQELTAHTKNQVAKLLVSPEYIAMYDAGSGTQTSLFIKKFLEENAAKIFSNILSSSFQNVINNASYNVR